MYLFIFITVTNILTQKNFTATEGTRIDSNIEILTNKSGKYSRAAHKN